MPRKKRRTKKAEPELIPQATVKEIFSAAMKQRKPRKRAKRQIVQTTVENQPGPKTIMQLIFEGQRAELARLNEELRAKLFG
jgi:hypothetical protein